MRLNSILGTQPSFASILITIGELWNEAEKPEGMQAAQASFRGELREYRDRVQARIASLRSQVDSGAKAIAAFAAGIVATGADHQKQTQLELSRLTAVARSGNIDEMRRAIDVAVTTISASLEEIRREHQGMIAQWQDEVRTLHREFQAERRAMFIDPVSGAWNRMKVDGRIEDLLRQNQSFFVLLIAVHDFNRLERRHSSSILESSLKALVRRLQTVAGPDIFLGRRSREEFVAILDLEADTAVALSRQVTKKLSGVYAVQENGVSHDVAIEVVAGVVERGQSADASTFMKKLGQMSAALARA